MILGKYQRTFRTVMKEKQIDNADGILSVTAIFFISLNEKDICDNNNT